MRPEWLRLRGFGAFRDATEIDFTGTELFALVGPTGSGKSTVIDAVCFALYGSVPRHGEKLVAPVISVGANEAAVELTFECGGARYVAARVVRRSGREGRVSTKEARLERLQPDGTTEIVAGAAGELLRAVEDLLGLSFSYFTRCVVLPQGEFARFLHDKPADRQALLERLLGLGVYDDMLKQANQRAAEAKAAADLAQRQLDGLPAGDDVALAAATERAHALTALVTDLSSARAELDARQDEAAAAGRRVVDGRRLVGALQGIAVPGQVAEVGRLLVDARRDEDVAAQAGADAAARRAVAQRELDALAPLDQLERALVVHERIATGRGVRADRERDVAKLRAALADADAAVARSEQAEAEARAAVDDARRANAAHDLAAHLVAGEPCPVCEQVVVVVARRRRPPAVEAALWRADTAQRAVTRARADAATATTAAHQADADLAQADGLLTALTEQVSAHPDRDVLAAQLAEVRVVGVAVDEARAAEVQAAAAHAVATDVVARLETALELAQSELHRQRDAVASLGPPAPGPDLLGAWTELASWAKAEVDVVAVNVDDATRLAAAATAAHDALLGALVGRARALGCDTPVRFDAVVTAVVRAEAQSAHTVRSIEAARDAAARLTAAVAAERERYHVAHELGRHLAAAGFPRWLVTEALELLVADASVLLRRLSDGKYSLVAADGGELDVVDHANADEVRPVRSLSGGETFQASLAFALALSDHLASLASAGAARLDAIFLDEGFGTLDADSLDTVAATIEALGGGGRMVGIVTHVRELAERVPVRYVVAKGPRSATVERVVA